MFHNGLIAIEKFKPDYFLFENNNSISKEIKAAVSKELGVENMMINSALLSAQNRKREYWFNWDCPQPEDKGILLRDILEHGIVDREKSYCLKHQAGNTRDYFKKHYTQVAFEPLEPVGCAMRTREDETGKYKRVEVRKDDKSNALTTVRTDSMVCEPIRIGDIGSTSQAHRVYSCDGKSVNIVANGGGQGAKTGLYAVPIPEHLVKDICDKGKVYHIVDGFIEVLGQKYKVAIQDGYYLIRKLTVKECRRLQTIPEWYVMPCSDSQNYRMLGNGWTIDVISWILSYMPNIKDEKIEVLSMYDGMSCGRLALENLDSRIAHYYSTEIDKYAIETTQMNFPETIQLGDAFQVREDGWKLR
jgi:DNA (cytosine-5)-methyltransferase 3A